MTAALKTIMRNIIFLTLCLVSTLALRGQSFEYMGLNYTINNSTTNECTLTGAADKSISTLDVPAYAIYLRTEADGQTTEVRCPVTTIGYSAFINSDQLEKVTMADNVRVLEVSAFEACDLLEEVQLSDNIESIGNFALRSLPMLSEIKLPRELKTLGYMSIASNAALSKIIFNDKLETIGRSAFEGNWALKEIILPGSIQRLCVQAFAACGNLKNVTFMGSIPTIEASAFNGCDKLESVHVPDLNTWLKMGFTNHEANPLWTARNLFFGDEKATDILIPGSFETVPPYSFVNSTIENVILEDGVKIIGYNAFHNCSELKSIDLGNTLEEIGSQAFSHCTSLENLTIPKTVHTINPYFLEYCENLKTLNWKGYIENIGGGGFGCLYSLKDLVIDNLSDWCRQNFPLADDSNPVKYAGTVTLNGQRITDLVIPDDVVSVGTSIFYAASELRSVVIPNHVKKLGSYAFFCCGHLNNVSIGNSIKSIDLGDVFYGCGSVFSLRFEDGTEPIVVTQATGWNEMSSLCSLYIGREITTTIFPLGLRLIEISKDLRNIGSIDYKANTNISFIQSFASEPPVMEEFSEEQYKKVKVLVPLGSREKYKETDVWKNFANIEECNPINFQDATIKFEQETYPIGYNQTIEIPFEITPSIIPHKDILVNTSSYSLQASIGEKGNLIVSGQAGTITLTIPYNGASATINIERLPTPQNISIVPDEIELAVGESIDVDVIVTPENAYPSEYEWVNQSSWNKYVSIEGNTVTALAPGKTTIYVEIKASSNAYRKQGSCKVTIDEASGVDETTLENNDSIEVYNLNGFKVGNSANDLAPGLYIIKQHGKRTKITVK